MPQLYSTNFFVLKLPDIDAAGLFMECAGLELSFEVLEYAEGGNNEFVRHLPGRLMYPNLVLSRGLTEDTKVSQWVAKTKTKPELKEITISLMTHDLTKPVRTWTFADAFPVRWVGPKFNAHGTIIATETLELAHAGLKEA